MNRKHTTTAGTTKSRQKAQQEFEIPEAPAQPSHQEILDTLKEKILAQEPPPHTSEPSGANGVREQSSELTQGSEKYLDLPSEKNYFRVREVAALLGVGAHVLRFWESEFSMVRPTKSRSGQRVYRRKDVALLARIQHLLHEKKLSIRSAREILLEERRQRLHAESESTPVARPSSSKSSAKAALKQPVSTEPALDLKEVLVDLRQLIRLCRQDPFEFSATS